MSDMLTLRKAMASLIVGATRTLLETKHLYQSEKVFDLDEFIDREMTAARFPEQGADQREIQWYSAIEAARANLRRAARHPWLPIQSEEGRRALEERRQQNFTTFDVGSPLIFEFPFARLYCRRCKGREPYKPLVVEDALLQVRSAPDPMKDPVMTDQIFTVLYQCQGCRSDPEFVVVARTEMKVRLVGRHPIETIEVPTCLPREESDLFRSGKIAFNTGNVLAAVFYLRTFIEQFARRRTTTSGRKAGDVLMGEYAATLPEELRSRIPSLAEWYEKLSEALHEARDDEALFLVAEEKILHHFEIRRAARID